MQRNSWRAIQGIRGLADSFDVLIDDSAFGVLLQFDVRLAKSIFSLGGEFGAMGYGSESRTVYIGNLIPDIPDLSLKVDTDNEMWLGHALVRAQRGTGRWRPYADALIGFTELSTKTSISGALKCRSTGSSGGVTCSTPMAAEATNAEDVVLSYGAAGVMIGLLSWSWSISAWPLGR